MEIYEKLTHTREQTDAIRVINAILVESFAHLF